MQIGAVALMIDAPLVVTAFFLVTISLIGALKSNVLFPEVALSLNTGPWPLQLQNFYGSNLSFQN